MEERKGVVTFLNQAVTLVGPEIKVGQEAPDFKLLAHDMSEVKLSDTQGGVRVLSSVTSLDTPICDLQTQKFDDEAARLKNVVFYTISMDLPFAQARYISARHIRHMKILSDHRDASFGMAYGVLIKEMRLLSRAIFVIDQDNIIRHAQYVRDVPYQPNYNEVTATLRKVVSQIRVQT